VDEFVTLRRMAGRGHALIFISHKLHEVQAISDQVTVLATASWWGSGRERRDAQRLAR
jgi:simple sugar transport system ATP-binding protein